MAAPADHGLRRVRMLVDATASAVTVQRRSRLDALCDAAVRDLELACASISMLSDLGPLVVARSQGQLAQDVADLQIACGEGPTFEAAAQQRPVLVRDLAAASEQSWSPFAEGAVSLGLGAIWVFPLGVGAAHLGALEMSFATRQSVSATRVRTGLHFAEVATESMLGAETDREPRDRQAEIDRIVDLKAVVYQAQGVLMVELDTSATDALVRMRAHAFAHDVDLDELARSIVDGTVHLDRG